MEIEKVRYCKIKEKNSECEDIKLEFKYFAISIMTTIEVDGEKTSVLREVAKGWDIEDIATDFSKTKIDPIYEKEYKEYDLDKIYEENKNIDNIIAVYINYNMMHKLVLNGKVIRSNNNIKGLADIEISDNINSVLETIVDTEPNYVKLFLYDGILWI